ncbi:hypothetical protein ABEX78_32340 [Priestia megaterium]
MMYRNTIKLTNSSGASHLIRTYNSVGIRENENDPVKSVDVSAEFISNREILNNHSIGSIIEIYNCPFDKPEQTRRIFYGVVTSVPKVLDGTVKKISFQAKCLLSRTQTILINEVYEDADVSTILRSLMRFTNFFDFIEIPIINTTATFSFKDEYLYDCIQKVTEAVGYNFEADQKTFRVFLNVPRINDKDIKKGMFEKGSASFTIDESRLTNHIRCYGGKELTPSFKEETFIANGTVTDFYTMYPPSNIELYVDDVRRTCGILYLNDSGFDAYMDYDQQMIQFPVAPAAGKKVKIKYKYYQRIVLEDSDNSSIEKYGIRSLKMTQDAITDRTALRQYIRDYISKYKDPILVGAINPFTNDWEVSDLVKINIPDINVNESLVVTEKAINLSPTKMDISLQFEQRPNLSDILKNHLDRIRALEKEKEEPETIDKFRSIFEKIELNEQVTVISADRESTFKIGVSAIGQVI